MNKKKITSIITAVTLCSIIVVGGTLAWFTDKGEATNVVTFGNVNIKLEETHEDGTMKEEGLIFKDITPGSVIKKDPTITNIGKNDCYIRAKVVFTEGAPIKLEDLDVDTSKWKLSKDGYYYYKELVSKNDKITLFNEVGIPSSIGNSAANSTFNINVEAEAIQSDNFKFDWNSETPWGETPINAETYVGP